MKKILLIIVMLLSIFFINILFENVYGTSYGDVLKYEITVTANKNGSINMSYNVNLKITEGEVTNVEIKLPHGVKSVISKGVNISSIEFSEDYRYANVKLYSSYNKGSTVRISFSLINNNVYEYNSNKDLLKYRLKIGKIKNFNNKDVVIKWNKSEVYFQGMAKEDDYYVFRDEFSYIMPVNVVMQYKGQKFNLSTDGEKVTIFSDFVLKYGLFAVAIAIIIMEMIANDNYKKNRGFRLNN